MQDGGNIAVHNEERFELPLEDNAPKPKRIF